MYKHIPRDFPCLAHSSVIPSLWDFLVPTVLPARAESCSFQRWLREKGARGAAEEQLSSLPWWVIPAMGKETLRALELCPFAISSAPWEERAVNSSVENWERVENTQLFLTLSGMASSLSPPLPTHQTPVVVPMRWGVFFKDKTCST